MVIRPCPIFPTYLFAEGKAIVWHNMGALTLVACKNGILWNAAVLSLLNSMRQPWLWTHGSQVHVCLTSDYFVSHRGLIQTLGISRRVEWEANCILVSSATHRVLGKQAPVWTSRPCLVCYCTCRETVPNCRRECWEPEKPLAGAKFHIWVFRLAPRGENTWNPTGLPIMRS